MPVRHESNKKSKPAPSRRLKKSLGQFLLRSPEIARKTAEIIASDSLVLEIGPGNGALTTALLNAHHEVIGVEIDTVIAGRLKRRFKGSTDFTLIIGDILDFDWDFLERRGESVAICGNLPYHLTSEILFTVFNQVRRNKRSFIREMVVMVQREVGERLTASPSSKAYGGITLLTSYHANVEYLFTVPADQFIPRPQVDGGVIHLKFRSPGQFPPVEYQRFRSLVRACFSQRRKMLRNSIKVLDDLPNGWESLDCDYSRRPEELSLEEFVNLTNDLQALSNNDKSGES